MEAERAIWLVARNIGFDSTDEQLARKAWLRYGIEVTTDQIVDALGTHEQRLKDESEWSRLGDWVWHVVFTSDHPERLQSMFNNAFVAFYEMEAGYVD